MQRNWASLLFVLLLAVTACGGQNTGASEQTVSISGAFALYPLTVRWTQVYQESHPAIRFDISAGGAGKGMTDVLNGMADIAMVSREIRDEEIKQGASPVAVARDAVVFTANQDNPLVSELLGRGASANTLAPIWLSENPGTWEEWLGLSSSGTGHPIHPYTRADASGAGEMAAKYLGANAQDELNGVAVQGDPGLLEAVRGDSAGLGYNNIAFAYDPESGQPFKGIAIIPLDLNDNGRLDEEEKIYADRSMIVDAIAAGKYPSPPSRVLYLVVKDQPSDAVKSFLRWILADGQQYVSEVGYVRLPDTLLQAGIDQLK